MRRHASGTNWASPRSSTARRPARRIARTWRTCGAANSRDSRSARAIRVGHSTTATLRIASAGAIAIGARPLLIAFNVELNSADLGLARAIARSLRERNGGLRTFARSGLRLAPDVVQVSFNLTDSTRSPFYRVRELVRLAAGRHGVRSRRSELIGLAPRRAIARTAAAYRASPPSAAGS